MSNKVLITGVCLLIFMVLTSDVKASQPTTSKTSPQISARLKEALAKHRREQIAQTKKKERCRMMLEKLKAVNPRARGTSSCHDLRLQEAAAKHRMEKKAQASRKAYGQIGGSSLRRAETHSIRTLDDYYNRRRAHYKKRVEPFLGQKIKKPATEQEQQEQN